MKSKEMVRLQLSDEVLRELEGDSFSTMFKEGAEVGEASWEITL
jgi:hypothetical protein